MTSQPLETALLLTVPAADPVVGPHRARLDHAAAVGVPAHVTVIDVFVPYDALGPAELERVRLVAASTPAFALRFEQTDWFGDDVVYLRPEPAEPVVALTRAMVAEFPDHPPYGDVYDEPVPHLTVGHAAPLEQLRVAEAGVLRHLPLEQEVTELTLWAGPPLLTGESGWRQVASFPLGPRA